MGGLCPSFVGPCRCGPLHAATAVAPPRQTYLSQLIMFLSAHALPSLLILMALSLNFPQIFKSSSGNNMARIKTNTPGGVFPWPALEGSAPGCLGPSATEQCRRTGLAFAFLSLSMLWHGMFLLTLFLPLPQGLAIFEHLGGSG